MCIHAVNTKYVMFQILSRQGLSEKKNTIKIFRHFAKCHSNNLENKTTNDWRWNRVHTLQMHTIQFNCFKLRFMCSAPHCWNNSTSNRNKTKAKEENSHWLKSSSPFFFIWPFFLFLAIELVYGCANRSLFVHSFFLIMKMSIISITDLLLIQHMRNCIQSYRFEN